MDNAKKTEVFCAFFLSFFPKKSVAIRWQVSISRKGGRTKAKIVNYRTEFIEKLICFKLRLVTVTQQVLYNPE